MKQLITIALILTAATASAQYTPETVSKQKEKSLKERFEYFQRMFAISDSTAELSKSNVPPPVQRAPISRGPVKAQAVKSKKK